MKGRLLANVSKKKLQSGIRSNIAYFVHIRNILNIACRKKIIKIQPFFISKFKFDRFYGKMLHDIHLKVI